jgi:hypothetical protein
VFRFNTHPAAVSVTEGVQIAFQFLQTTWRRWLPWVAAVAACSFVLYWLFSSLANSVYVDDYTNQVVWGPGAAAKAAGAAVAGLVYLAVSLVGGWVFAATAICGLRNRPLTPAYVASRGLLALVAGILIAIAGLVALIAAFMLIVIVFELAPLVGVVLLLLAILGAIPVAIYLTVRIGFYTLAIFDGFGPIEGIRESWLLSQRSVLRMFGWGLMAYLITAGFSIAGSLVALPFSIALPPLGQAISSVITTTASCFTVFMMAVLYESQRARRDPSLYEFTPGPGYPAPYPGGPYPYAPGPYPVGPYPSAPGPYPVGPYPYAPGPNPSPYPAWPAYPPSQGGMPGWVNPNAPAWPGYPPAYPGTPPAWGANPNAGPAWKSGESEEPLPGPGSGTRPTDPPAAT